MFEDIWNARHIERVEIVMKESVDIRGKYQVCFKNIMRSYFKGVDLTDRYVMANWNLSHY